MSQVLNSLGPYWTAVEGVKALPELQAAMQHIDLEIDGPHAGSSH